MEFAHVCVCVFAHACGGQELHESKGRLSSVTVWEPLLKS